MEKISNVQLIDVGAGRTVVRYYNAEKDCFERICKAKQVFVLGLNGKDDSADKLMILDARIWLLWNGRLRYVGLVDEGLLLLQSGGCCLRKYDLSHTPLPFHCMIVSFDELLPREWVPTTEYSWDDNQVTAKEYFSGRKFCFEVPRGVLSDLKPCIICRG